jgi:hypothetical protein
VIYAFSGVVAFPLLRNPSPVDLGCVWDEPRSLRRKQRKDRSHSELTPVDTWDATECSDRDGRSMMRLAPQREIEWNAARAIRRQKIDVWNGSATYFEKNRYSATTSVMMTMIGRELVLTKDRRLDGGSRPKATNPCDSLGQEPCCRRFSARLSSLSGLETEISFDFVRLCRVVFSLIR